MSSTVSNFTQYQPVDATSTFHGSPRFGHTNDFSKLFSSNGDTQTDYVQGIIFIGVLVLCFFLVWLLLLFIFKCLGQRRVGFLSGDRMIETEKGGGRGCCTRPNIVRTTFCVSTLTVIIFTALLVSKGLTNLKNTTTSLDKSNVKVANTIDQFQGIASDLRTVGLNANSTRQQIMEDVNNFCPNINLQQVIGVDIQTSGKDAAAMLQQLGDFINGKIGTAQTALDKAAKATQQVHKGIDQVNFKAIAISAVVIYIVLPTILLVSVFMAWFGFSSPIVVCMTSWLILPMWFVMVILAVLCTAISSWLVIANSDFCSGGTQETPDDTIKAILVQRNIDVNSFLGQVVYFYITQCRTTDPWAFIQGYQQNLTAANATVGILSDQLNPVTLPELESVCQQNFTPFQELLVSMESTLNILATDAQLGLNLLSCNRIVPIYTSTIYGTACDYSVSALAWSFSGFLVISFFGFLMITFRSAYHEVVRPTDYENKSMELDPYANSVPPDDEDLTRSWNTYGPTAPVVDYGDGRKDDDVHNPYHDGDSSYQVNNSQDGYSQEYSQEGIDHDHNVEYYEEPQVIQHHLDDGSKGGGSNGYYRSNVY